LLFPTVISIPVSTYSPLIALDKSTEKSLVEKLK